MVRVKITTSVTVRENFDLWDWSKSHLQSLWKGRWVSLSIPFQKKKNTTLNDKNKMTKFIFTVSNEQLMWKYFRIFFKRKIIVNNLST